MVRYYYREGAKGKFLQIRDFNYEEKIFVRGKARFTTISKERPSELKEIDHAFFDDRIELRLKELRDLEQQGKAVRVEETLWGSFLDFEIRKMVGCKKNCQAGR